MKIFIGGAREAITDLECIASWVEEFRHTPVPWNDTGVFPPGLPTFTRLVDLAHSVDAAIFLFSEDDKVWHRSDTVLQPRDNVMIEYGLFLGALGPHRVVFCIKGGPKTASDLLGVGYIDISDGHLKAAKYQLRSWVAAVAEHDSSRMETQQLPQSRQAASEVRPAEEAGSRDCRDDVCTIGHKEYVDLVERLDTEHRLDHSPLYLALLRLAPGSCKEVRELLVGCRDLPSGMSIEGVYDVFGPYDIIVKVRAPNFDYEEVKTWISDYLGGRRFLGPRVDGMYKLDPTLVDVAYEFCRVRRQEISASWQPRGIIAFVHITHLENDAEVFQAFEKCRAVRLSHGPAAQITGAYLAHKELVAQFYLTCGGYYDLAKVVYGLESDLQRICRAVDRVTLLAMSAWES